VRFIVRKASKPGRDEEPNNEIAEAAVRAASALVTDLRLHQMALTTQNPKAAPYLTVIVSGFVDSAAATISGTPTQSAEGAEQHDED
jgi:hypothetical protein